MAPYSTCSQRIQYTYERKWQDIVQKCVKVVIWEIIEFQSVQQYEVFIRYTGESEGERAIDDGFEKEVIV